MKKKLIALFMLVIMAISTSVPAYAANKITYIHGNESNRCYAETTQTSDEATIGAKITWQLSGEDTIVNGSLVSSTGSSAKSRSKWLWGKEGKSFGYYYVNGVQRHKSTAWMDFDF